MEELKKLSQDLKKRMKDIGITQADIASITGIGIQTVGAIIRGKEGTAIKNWIVVCDVLGANFEITTKRMSDETRKGI
jgi:transcriptional regulator with XRE-family HTH domain